MSDLKFHLNFILIAITVLMIGSSALAQNSLKERISKIEGDVDKITINAGGEEFMFEGKDAQKLFKRMKSGTKSMNTIMFSTDGDSLGNNKIIIKSDDGKEKVFKTKVIDADDIVWIGDDDCMHGLKKKVKVEVEDGSRKVTVITTEDGEEKSEVYEGDEADKILEKMKSEKGHEMFISIDKNGDNKKMKKIIIEMEEETSKEK